MIIRLLVKEEINAKIKNAIRKNILIKKAEVRD